MSCELKYRFTSLLCKIVNNNMQSLQGTDRNFFVRISFLRLNYFLLTATSRGKYSKGELKGLIITPSSQIYIASCVHQVKSPGTLLSTQQ